jgi:hypothetical protein
MVTGSVAADDAVPHAAIEAGVRLDQSVHGFCLVESEENYRYDDNKCSAMPTNVPPNRTPTFNPISLTRCQKVFSHALLLVARLTRTVALEGQEDDG